jgi:RNA polymerase primary sigma factor
MIEDENDTYEDQIEIDKSIIQDDLKSSIKEALGRLNPKEAEILRLRFGLDGHNILTLEQVGNIFGVKRERIRQQEAKALRKLRHPSITQNLRQFL